MKMSKSIKDYKDAMDSISISDSFYKRTEVLLNESSQMEIVRSNPPKMKIITRSVMAIAACLVLAFGVKTVIDNRTETESAVVTEIVQETTVVTVPLTVPETASPVIDRPDEKIGFLNDSGVIVGDMPAIPTEETISATTATECADEDDTDSDTDDDILIVEEEFEEAAPIAPVETTATTAREGYPEMAEPKGSENIPPLSEMTKETVSVKITPYFDRGAIKSGENHVSGYGNDYSELISTLHEITGESIVIENESFKSVFLIQLSDSTSGITYYSIYVTDASTLVVTRHDIDNQKRFTYGLSQSDYNSVLYQLYVEFGIYVEFDSAIYEISE